MNISLFKKTITIIIESKSSVSQKLQAICNYLNQEIEHYNWVGFYFKNGTKKEINYLDPRVRGIK